MSNSDDSIHQFAENTAKIKLPGGIVGKTCYVLMAVCGALAAIVIAIRTESIGYAAIGALVIIVIWALNRVFRFADANPELATMDGSEIVSFKRMQLAQKGYGPIEALPAESPPGTVELLPAEQDMALLPDQSPTEKKTLEESK